MFNLFKTNEFGPQKLSVCFESLQKHILKFEPSSIVPSLLIWPAILCTCHSSKTLRSASYKLLMLLLKHVCPDNDYRNTKILKKSYDILSKEGCNTINELEKFIPFKFFDDFPFAFATYLNGGLHEIETRNDATELLKFCVQSTMKNPNQCVPFLTQLIIFGPIDISSWIIETISDNKKTLPEIVFNDFDSLDEKESLWITNYLSFNLGSIRQDKFDIILDLLTYGSLNHQNKFSSISKALYNKSMLLIQNSVQNTRIEKLATLLAALCSIPVIESNPNDFQDIKKIDENEINELISSTLFSISQSLYINHIQDMN